MRGFSLVEILLGVGLVGMIVALSMPYVSRLYLSAELRGDKELLLGLLREARLQSMNNIGQTSHGVAWENGSYILFAGSGYVSGQAGNLVYPASASVTHGGASAVIFSQLTGEASWQGGAAMELRAGQQLVRISVSPEGRIDWAYE